LPYLFKQEREKFGIARHFLKIEKKRWAPIRSLLKEEKELHGRIPIWGRKGVGVHNRVIRKGRALHLRIARRNP